MGLATEAHASTYHPPSRGRSIGDLPLRLMRVHIRDGSDVKIRISADADSHANTSARRSADANTS